MIASDWGRGRDFLKRKFRREQNFIYSLAALGSEERRTSSRGLIACSFLILFPSKRDSTLFVFSGYSAIVFLFQKRERPSRFNGLKDLIAGDFHVICIKIGARRNLTSPGETRTQALPSRRNIIHRMFGGGLL